MPPSPIDVTLVGCGTVSQLFYAPALSALEAAGVLSVSAIVDPSPAARGLLQVSFPAASASATMANTPPRGPGLAIIASPPKWHAPLTLDALDRGWNVLCEKPMAASAAEADQMNAKAEGAGLILAVGHYKRFFPSSLYLKSLCGPGGALGALQYFSIAEGGPFNWPASSPSFFRKQETQGGVLLDMGIHALDLLLWWLGEPDSFTYADDAMGGLEANAVITMRFRSSEGRIQFSRDWQTSQRYEFKFEKGQVGWTVNEANVLDLKVDGTPYSLRATLQTANADPARTNAQSFIAQLQNLADAIHHRDRVLVDGRAGAQALALIEACYSRRTLLNQPWLTNPEIENAAKWATLP